MRLKLTGKQFATIVSIAWISLVVSFFSVMTIIIFPMSLVENAPQIITIEGVNGYALLQDNLEIDGDNIFKLQGEWEFYPNKLYNYSDFTSGRVGESIMVKFPHYWRDEPKDVIDVKGYATYRMRTRVPASFDNGVGLYSRYQYSAYKAFVNDVVICEAGVVDEDSSNYKTLFLPTNGYSNFSVGSDGRTLSVIVQVQNEVHNSGGLNRNIYIGSSTAVKNLRTLLLMMNGIISGGLLLLSICLFMMYLSGRDRMKYLDYTLVALVALFVSLTTGGESLLYSVGIDGNLLLRLEYSALVTGAFCANYSTIRGRLRQHRLFRVILLYTVASIIFFLIAPPLLFTKFTVVNMIASGFIFTYPLIRSAKASLLKHDFDAVISIISYVVVFFGMIFYATGTLPWDSIDLFSLAIMIHCILQMVIFLHQYQMTEKRLKIMTETLEERIAERTIELTLMKEKAESATIAKSNFLATMSHEIRTPMNAIIGMSDLMRTDNLDKVQLSYLMDIKKSSKSLLQIINDILDFSKIEAGKLEIIPTHFNLMTVYDNICSMCYFTANEKGLVFRHSFEEDVPHYIYGDETRYRQVIINIVNNAIKYTKEGYVDFKVKTATLHDTVFLVIVVEDTGIGIKEEDFPRLFGTFEQLDSKSNRKILGTGLGLSITKLLVNMMDGDIQFISEYGKGSTFTIYLPLVQGDSTKVEVQDAYVPVIASDAQVLVVDDNKINLTVASGFLATHSIQTDTATSGAQAIEMIQNKHYDLVFMDHMMPEMDGVEVAKIIRSLDDIRFRDMPIIALTANAVTGTKDIFKEAGMNDFLSKPIDAAHLNLVLTKWLPQHKILRRSDDFAIVMNESINEHEELFNALCLIEGLDVQEGLSHVGGSRSVYVAILRQYCKELNGYIIDINNCLAEDDWPNYAIRLHAIKGVFANLGVRELSEWAARLETAAKSASCSVCISETESICESMLSFKEKLMSTKFMDEEKPVEKTPIDAQALKSMLNDLRGVCMMGDSDSADAIRNELAARSLNNEMDAALDEICDLVDSFDFDIVAKKIDSILTSNELN